ncbi:MAG: 3-keto-5-aminohexanoate cleavage protein, partial [Verrucomicrobia bacterium]|nr:3-keto-5-aminohexanoate cleavage protein [Verrucomicrobiota bacterium]
VTWAATGIGQFAFPVQSWAIAMGGHVRVGIEDSIFMDAGKTEHATNLKLVERVVRVGKAVGRRPATPAEVRARLQLSR